MEDKQKQNLLYLKGSEWKKWDLHVHSPKTYGGSYDDFINNITNSEAEVIGINDYSTIEGYEEIISKYRDKVKKILFPVIEFRMNNILVDKSGRKGIRFNFHIIFDNDTDLIPKIKTWLSALECLNNKGRPDKVGNIEKLDNKISFDYFKVIESLESDTHLKNKFLVWLPYDEYGGIDDIDPEQDKYFKLGLINKAHIIGSSNLKQINFFVWKSDKYKEEDIKKWLNGRKIPCIKGSDAHKINYPFGKLKDEKSKPTNKYCWIKADPTFEGLKQILYEPEPGERVWIGEIPPDRKNNYQVIKKIKFTNTNDFPEEIIFNQNLCSIIGSRASGKSALLNYIAHAIDQDLVENQLGLKNAGEGEEYSWDKIKKSGIKYEIEWANGISNEKSPGKIVYIPQNYLFKESKDSEKVKEKIEPVLFKKYPEFKKKYNEVLRNLKEGNEKIKNLVEEWFKLRSDIDSIETKLKELGDEESVKKEKEKIEGAIEQYKKKYSLDGKEIKKYKELNIKITELEDSITIIQEEMIIIESILGGEIKFRNLIFKIEPNENDLPPKLKNKILEVLESNKRDLLSKINDEAKKYYENLSKKFQEGNKELAKIKQENKLLFEKYRKNQELEILAEKLSKFEQVLKQILEFKKQKQINEQLIKNKQNDIKHIIDNRIRILEELKKHLDSFDQEKEDIKFSVEYGIKQENLEIVSQKVNLNNRTDFVINKELKIENVRREPAKLLKDIYCGNQKINKGYDKKQVAIELLTLTESILFVGEMEGDRIGGFKETTMTPGRRALFLLKLILAESDDKWPLLIDQPEENLDSKSIAFEIVPFLKKKKKERQIIMASHNANLVIGADSEQIIVANRHGGDSPNEDRRTFNYLSGSIENTKEEDKNIIDTLKRQGIKEHACLILDGGKDAFEQRKNKYNLNT